MSARGRGERSNVRVDATKALIVLVVEETTIANLAAMTLRHAYDVRTISGTAAARAALGELTPHLVIVDVDDDDGQAIELISESERDGKVPMIALTRRSDLARQLEAFDRGADDVIGIPFVPADLAARVLAVMRRAYGKAPPAFRPLRVGDLEIDLVGRQVRAARAELHLTALEQALLYLLASNAGTTLTREAILDAIWGTDFLADSNVVDRHVRSLRVKLQNDWREPKYIETVTGIGYRFRSSEDSSKPRMA